MSTFIDMTNPDNREYVALATCIARLRLMINTGLGERVSTIQAAKRNWPLVATGRTKKVVLRQLEELFEERYGRPYGEH